MIKQYIKQALRMIGENKLLSVISILGTALAICMIMVIVILYVVNTASFKPEVNRGRTCYITTVMSNGKDDNRRISYSSLGLPLVKECCYPLKGAEAVTAINMDRYRPLTASSMDGLKNRTSYISYTDTAFWKVFQFDFLQGGPFSPAAFTSGIRNAVISESVALALFGTDQVVGREMKLDFIVYNICGVVKDVSRFASKAWAEVWIPYTVRDDGGYQEGITLSRMRRRMAELGVRRAFGATQGTILWQVLSENMVLTLLGGLLGLAMSYGAMLLLRDWLLVTSLGKTGLSTGMFNGAVFIAAFLFCLVLNLFSAGLPAWRMSRLNITDSING